MQRGLPVGYWLKEVKQYLWQGRPDDFRFIAMLYHEHYRKEREFVLGEIRERFVTITRGQKIVCRGCSLRQNQRTEDCGACARGRHLYREAPIWIGMRTKPGTGTTSRPGRPASWRRKRACAN